MDLDSACCRWEKVKNRTKKAMGNTSCRIQTSIVLLALGSAILMLLKLEVQERQGRPISASDLTSRPAAGGRPLNRSLANAAHKTSAAP